MPALLYVFAIALSSAVATSDLYARRVPNRWLLYALVFGTAWLMFDWLSNRIGFPLAHLLGLIIGLISMLPFYAIGWMGAGDAKFFAILGFLLGWHALLSIWIIASLLAGAYALVVILSRLSGWQASISIYMGGYAWWQKMQAARQGRRGTPYAACLAIGTILTVLYLRESP